MGRGADAYGRGEGQPRAVSHAPLLIMMTWSAQKGGMWFTPSKPCTRRPACPQPPACQNAAPLGIPAGRASARSCLLNARPKPAPAKRSSVHPRTLHSLDPRVFEYWPGAQGVQLSKPSSLLQVPMGLQEAGSRRGRAVHARMREEWWFSEQGWRTSDDRGKH